MYYIRKQLFSDASLFLLRSCISIFIFEELTTYTVKKRLTMFPSPAGMSLTKLSPAGNNLIIPGPPGQGVFGYSASRLGRENR
jgi:hypothetical protein